MQLRLLSGKGDINGDGDDDEADDIAVVAPTPGIDRMVRKGAKARSRTICLVHPPIKSLYPPGAEHRLSLPPIKSLHSTGVVDSTFCPLIKPLVRLSKDPALARFFHNSEHFKMVSTPTPGTRVSVVTRDFAGYSQNSFVGVLA